MSNIITLGNNKISVVSYKDIISELMGDQKAKACIFKYNSQVSNIASDVGLIADYLKDNSCFVVTCKSIDTDNCILAMASTTLNYIGTVPTFEKKIGRLISYNAIFYSNGSLELNEEIQRVLSYESITSLTSMVISTYLQPKDVTLFPDSLDSISALSCLSGNSYCYGTSTDHVEVQQVCEILLPSYG